MHFSTIIGLEVHVQLLTKTKIFCGCANRFNPRNPNVQTCPVCLGLPGSLPVMNREAFRLSLKTAMALNCQITRFTKWDRKQYYYPDLPKNYQISQYDLPFSSDGWLEIETESDGSSAFQTDSPLSASSKTKRVRLIRVHLEEDAGKNLHDESGQGADSQVDLNRAGTPLLEIVSQPDIRLPQQARAYLEELKLLLNYLAVSDCNMQEGSLRCDANVNLHVQTDDGEIIPTPIVEIKNLNSFRGVELALNYEIKRQIEQWKQTGQKLGDVEKETRGWDADREVTFAQRGKEEASDYRYFPDPDLVPVSVSEELIETICSEMCELPAARRCRFQLEFQLSNYDAMVIIGQGRIFADYYEQVANVCGDGKQAANWVTQDVLRELNDRQITIDEFPIRPPELSALLTKITGNEITTKSAREIFSELLVDMGNGDEGKEISGARIDQIIDQKDLGIVSDVGQLDAIIAVAMGRNKKAVADFCDGKQTAIGRIIGEVMREVKGADPKLVRKMIVDKIGS